MTEHATGTENIEAPDLAALVAADDWESVESILEGMADPDVAKVLPTLERVHWTSLLNRLPSERAASVYAYLSTDQQAQLLEDLSNDEMAEIIGQLSYDDAAALLEELPDEHTELLMEMLPRADQEVLQTLLAYPEDSAGRLMTPEFVSLRQDWDVRQSLEHVRRWAENGESLNSLFVTSDNGQILGWVRLQDLLLGRPSERLETIIQPDVISIAADEDQEEAARLIRHYDQEVLPVVDSVGRLAGIITVDDIMDVVEEETTEDFQKMGSVGVLNLSIKEATTALLYRKRIGWLIILVFVNMFAGAAIGIFEASIEQVVALVFFLPMIIASGGNAGAQASTLMVRALATGDVHVRDWLKLWGKELLVAFSLGVTMGLAVWAAAVWLGGPQVGLAVAISMVLVVITGSMIGMLLPFVLARFRLDPATASAPLITSLVDIAGILMYFSIATIILQSVPQAG
jgi:magnesium transporter